MSESGNIWLVLVFISLLSCDGENTAKVDSHESLITYAKCAIDIDGRITSIVKYNE